MNLSKAHFNFYVFLFQVSKAYSKTWSFREDALLEVMKLMSELETGSDDARSMLRAAVFLVNKGLKDKVFAVSTHSTSALEEQETETASDRCTTDNVV